MVTQWSHRRFPLVKQKDTEISALRRSFPSPPSNGGATEKTHKATGFTQ